MATRWHRNRFAWRRGPAMPSRRCRERPRPCAVACLVPRPRPSGPSRWASPGHSQTTRALASHPAPRRPRWTVSHPGGIRKAAEAHRLSGNVRDLGRCRRRRRHDAEVVRGSRRLSFLPHGATRRDSGSGGCLFGVSEMWRRARPRHDLALL
ncbi:hypothetical protein DFJ74DRAFT_297883 [Hyaloraphidium curvatum]|nr:hypothetical protein DFJ74DRAFT_297883 [Hyaloraphidium curvatum]